MTTPHPPPRSPRDRLPPGRPIDLPGRGRLFVREMPAPANAPVLVLLHGLGATSALNWFAVFPALEGRFRVLAVDHRGHGRGIRAWRRFRLADCADDVAALLERLEIPRAILAGYSMGGPIAQLAWHRHRDRVSGLVFCATAFAFGPVGERRWLHDAWQSLAPGAGAVGRFVPHAVRRTVVHRWTAGRLRNPATRDWVARELSRHNFGQLLEAAQAITRYDARAWIGEVDVPTAVVVTEHDGLVPPKRQLELAAAISGSTVHSVAGDHGACAYQAHVFVPAFLEACDSVASRLYTMP